MSTASATPEDVRDRSEVDDDEGESTEGSRRGEESAVTEEDLPDRAGFVGDSDRTRGPARPGSAETAFEAVRCSWVPPWAPVAAASS
jgi:hypothetical protein